MSSRFNEAKGRVLAVSLASMECQAEIERDRIRELEGEKAGLERFLSQVGNEETRFAQQLQGKRCVGSRARSLDRSKVAQGLASMIESTLGSGFSGGVNACYQGIRGNARNALDEVEREIRQARNRIVCLEQDMASERRRLAQEEAAQCEEKLERLKSERGYI